MNDDLVTRLQQWGTHEYLKETNINAIMCEAADEIERLRTTNDAFIHVIENCMDEIERLRWQIQGMKDSYDHLEEISKSQRETMTKYLFQEEQQ